MATIVAHKAALLRKGTRRRKPPLSPASCLATLIVEQRVDAVLPVASRVAFIENGRIATPWT